jgi:hypothetical protein
MRRVCGSSPRLFDCKGGMAGGLVQNISDVGGGSFHGGTKSNQSYVAPALSSLLATCQEF